jgi:seryl-tRNA synthetase
MLDIAFIRDNPDIVRSAIKNKNRQDIDLDEILRLAEERKKLAGDISETNRKRNEAQSSRDIEAGKKLKEELSALEDRHKEVEKQLVALLIKLPNIPSADTPVGPDESGNVVVRQWGEKRKFDFTPKPHWEIGKELGIIDSEKAAEVSGARFTYLKGDLALMQFALIQLAMQALTTEDGMKRLIEDFNLTVDPKPFVAVIPPVMMRSQVMNRMARLDPIDERYYFEKDDMVFVGSAEHTMGPLHMDEIIDEAKLPIRYVGYSTAFRREAGSYGKDTKGILRQHQFDKIEMESFSRPEDGLKEQELLVAVQEYLMQELNLPYQVMLICTGDMGFPDQRQIDIETWMPGQDKFRETHSSDYVGGFQARRLNTRVRRASGEIEPVHMNDATVFAVGRTLIAIIENYQNADGSITIPEALRPYMGGREKIDLPAGRQGR